MVHDHTHRGYRFVGLPRKRPFTHRIAFPCCDHGCEDRERCDASGGDHELKPRITDWPVDADFKVVPLDTEWVQRVCVRWCAARRTRFMHSYATMVDGCTEMRATRPGEFADHDLPARTPELVPCLPMGLIDGPVPFHPDHVARYVLGIINRKPYTLAPPPGYEYIAPNSWRVRVRPVLGHTQLHEIPMGFAESDMPPDTGTWAKPAYEVGSTGIMRDLGEWCVWVSGVAYTDIEAYTRAWIVAKTREIDFERARVDEFRIARDKFVRQIYVGAAFVNYRLNRVRMYLDETLEGKRKRAIDEFGPEFAPKLLALPISCFGPEYEGLDDEQWEDDGAKPYDSDEESDTEEEKARLAKRVKRSDLTAMDLLVERIEGFMRAREQKMEE